MLTKNKYGVIIVNAVGNSVNYLSGCSAAGSAHVWGAWCRRFKSCHSDHTECSYRTLRVLYDTRFFIAFLTCTSGKMNIYDLSCVRRSIVFGQRLSSHASPQIPACVTDIVPQKQGESNRFRLPSPICAMTLL